MEDEPKRAALLIADISGYTRYMTSSRVSLAHAQLVITELMKSVISEIKIPLRIIEVEGDGIFFYGIEEPGVCAWDQVVSTIGERVLDFFNAFYRRLDEIKQSNMCPCRACGGISDLKLKIIAHVGDVLFYTIEKFSKLGGPDVILVHRLLKNTIEAKEYLVMTDSAFREMSRTRLFEVEERVERYDDLGKIRLHVHYPRLGEAAGAAKPQGEVPLWKKLGRTMKLAARGMLIASGLTKQPRFHNLPRMDEK
jgi:hypothetical protein